MLTHADARTWLRAAKERLALGCHRDARRLLEGLLDEDPESPMLLNAVGALRYDAGDLDQARTALESCLTKAPEHPLAHMTLGELALRRKDAQAALRHLEVTLRSKAPEVAAVRQWTLALYAVAQRRAAEIVEVANSG
jgi:predicted Zn-dependent protease